MSDWIKTAYVGQKVVCSAQAPFDRVPNKNYPEPEGIYTIRKVVLTKSGYVAFLLDEIRNIEHSYLGQEPYFNSHYFKPLESRKTDISIFKEIANNPSLKISEGV